MSYNRTLGSARAPGDRKGMVFVIRPTAPCVSRTERDLEKLEDFYWHGYEEARAALSAAARSGWSSGRNVSHVCCGKDKTNC